MTKQLTPAQIEELKPYEKHFGSVIRAGYSSYPGEAALEKMRSVWNELTGTPYPFRVGCSDCIMNLLRDVGTLYFAATGIDPWSLVEKKVYSHGSLVSTEPAGDAKAPQMSKSTPKKKTAKR